MTRLKCQITTHFPKFLKVFFCNKLQIHIHSNILAQEQYGFRTNYSTKLVTYNLTNNILTALDNKLLIGGLSCNVTKAFDCVKHDTLLAKFGHYGINGMAGDLIKSYLNEIPKRNNKK